MASPRKDAYRTFGVVGSIRSSVAPSDPSGAAFNRVQLTPPSFDSHRPYVEWTGGVVRCAPPRPRMIAAYRWLALLGSIARRATDTPKKKSPETWAQVVPPSVDFRMPLPV